MSGKVFGGGQHPALVGAADISRYKISDRGGIAAEGARVDDRIRRIGIYVGVGEEIPLHSDGARFEGGNATKEFGVFDFAGGSEGHGVGKDGGAIQAHGDAAFKVGSDDQRQLRGALEAVEQIGGHVGLTLDQYGAVDGDAHDQPPKVILADVVAHLNEEGIGIIQELRVYADGEELAR